MGEKVDLHIVSKSDFAAGRWPPGWRDEGGILQLPSHMGRMLVHNPLSRAGDDPVMAVATVGDSVAGRVNLMPGELRVEGEGVPALWGFSLLVSPDFRGMGVASKVVAAWRDCWDTAIGNSVNEISAPIYPKLGWDLFEATRLQLIVRSRRFVDGFARPAALAAPLAGALDLGLAAWRGLAGFSRNPFASELSVRREERMSPEHDAALARQRAPVMHHRSAAWVNWLLDCPDPDQRDRYRLHTVWEGDRALGYFLLSLRRARELRGRFRDVEVGCLKDWAIFDPDRARSGALGMLLLAARELHAAGADVLMLTPSGLPDDGLAALHRIGFRPREPQRMSFYAHASSPLAAEMYHRKESWFVTEIDSDGLFL